MLATKSSDRHRRLFRQARGSVTDPAVVARLVRAEFSLDYVETMRRVYRAEGKNGMLKPVR